MEGELTFALVCPCPDLQWWLLHAFPVSVLNSPTWGPYNDNPDLQDECHVLNLGPTPIKLKFEDMLLEESGSSLSLKQGNIVSSNPGAPPV